MTISVSSEKVIALWALLSGCSPPEIGADLLQETATDTALDTPTLCSPQAVMTQDLPVERDLVLIQLSCESDVDKSVFSLRVHTEVLGVVLDTETWQLSWQTDLEDAGPGEFLFSVAGPGQGLPETLAFTAWITDNHEHASNISVDPQTYLWEFGLPVIHLTTPSSMTEQYQAAQLDFQGSHYAMEAKLRGAASLGYPKNSYLLKFSGEHLDASEFGLPDKDHLVLTTTFDDNSYVRQKLIYDLWWAIADYWGQERMVVRSFFTVLYLNGEYHGLYVATDHVDNQLMEQMGLNKEGNLYKSVDHNANYYATDYYGQDKSTPHDGFEKKEGEPEGGELAFADLDSFVRFAYESSDETFLAEADSWFDLDEFMDWFLLVYFTHSQDSGGKNAYLYNDPDNPGFRFTPWDFNASFGQDWMTQRIGAGVVDDFFWANNLFRRFQSQDELATLLWARLDQMRDDGPLSPSWFQAQLSAYYADIHPSATRDWEQWGEYYLNYGGWAWWRNQSGDWTTYEEEAAYLVSWLEDRSDRLQQLHP